MCERYGRDPARVIALGYSNGANIAVELLFRHGGSLRGAALLRPMLPYRPDEPFSLGGTDVLIASGDGDPYSSPQQIDELAELLAAAGAEVEVARQPVGHELTQGDLDAVAAWIRPHVEAA
jgi:phospholipase/carboxylesterase